MQNRYRRLLLGAIVLLSAVAGVGGHALAVTFSEFPIPTANSSPNDREFGRRSGDCDAPDLVGLSFREPQRAIRAGGDVVRTAVGCGNREFAKGHRQRVPADACDR